MARSHSCFRVSGEPVLPPGFINRYGHRVGQVQATAALTHRQAQALVAWQGVEHLGRQATAFGTEHERIARSEAGVVKRPRALGGKGEQARMPQAFQTTGEVCMALQGGILVVVETGPAQALVIHLEAQRFDQMQVAAAVGAQPDNVAGIRRNFWLKKDDVKHARLRR